MSELLKEFSIKDINLFRDDENVDFSIAEVYFLSDGNNAQNCPISTEVLKRDAQTALGKPIVAKYHRELRDVGTHETDEVIIGWLPESSTIEFKEKDGKTFAVGKAVLSKIYATDVYKLFLDSNERAVSCEFSAHQPDVNYLGEGSIEGFSIHGITVLGKRVSPCIDGADIKIMKFSEKDADKFYKESTSTNMLKSFAEERKNKVDSNKYESHPIDKSKSSLDESDWDGEKAKHDLIKEKNYKTLAKSVCLDLGDGWEDRKVTSLKYPVMNLKDGKWVYNKEGLNSAHSYSAQHDQEVEKKVIAIKKKLGLIDNKDKEETMAEEVKDFAKDGEEEIIMEDKKEEIVEEKDKAFEEETKDEEEKPEEAKEDDKVEEKKFSLDAYADCGATLAFLEHETEEHKALAEKVMKEMSAEDIVKTVVEFAKEIEDLKKFKSDVEEKEQQRKFGEIMASVKGDLDEKTFSDLYAEGEKITLENMSGFENKVKAFAYEATKKKDAEESNPTELRFSMDFGTNKTNDDGDVFAKIANK